jgi:hypothetical protein
MSRGAAPRSILAVSVAAALLLACAQEASDPPDTPEATGVPEAPGAPEGEETDAQADPPPEPPGEEATEPVRRQPPDVSGGFEGPDQLADVLVAAEASLADPTTPEEERTGWARSHQRAYRELAANPTWRDPVRDRMPARFEAAFDLTSGAVDELLQLTTPRQELPTDWRIVAPRPVDELRGYFDEAEAATGVPWAVLAAINLVETRFGRIEGDSHAGAQGPMQFMPPTWDAYGEGDVRDPRDAIHAAARYLAASGAPGDLRAAVFAYNRSGRYVEAVLAHAEAMERYDHYLDVYHRWQVFYRTTDGDIVLDEGYGS